MTDWVQQLVLLAVSLVSNIFSAFSGGGAGLVQFPVLIFLGLPFGVALATHKVASVALGLGATLRHVREGSLDLKLASRILIFGLPGVVLGATVILDVPERWAQTALGVFTIGLGIYSISNRQLGLMPQTIYLSALQALIGGLGLFAIGVLNGSLSSGTGLFCTLWLVRWYGLSYQQAVAHTLILVGLFWNGTGAITLGLLGELKWEWLPALLMGSLAGGYIGAHWSIITGGRWVKRAFEVVTMLVGLKLIL